MTPAAYAARAFKMATTVAGIAQQRWTVNNETLPDPDELESLLSVFTSLELAATDEYVDDTSTFSTEETLKYLHGCFFHARYELDSFLQVGRRASPALLEVSAELAMLIGELEESWKAS